MKLTIQMKAAIEFLEADANEFAKSAPLGREMEWYAARWFMPLEPSYSWRSYYGEFAPQTLRALVKIGLVETEARHPAWFRLTDAGRRALLERSSK